MCRFRERRSWGYECIVRGHRCATFPSKRRICEQNMRMLMPGVEVWINYDPERRQFVKVLA